MLNVQSGLSVFQLKSQKSGTEFCVGHFDRFVREHAELICSARGHRYIFGPEAIDLGPCCDPCDENWKRILKNEDVLKFSRGYIIYLSGDEIVRTAKQIIIPETCDVHGSFLGVVLRKRHPKSNEGSVAAFLCPPFGVIELHKFAFGYDSDISWPLAVGSRFWVKLDTSVATARVWKVVGKGDNVQFGRGMMQQSVSFPKIYRWQLNKIFNQRGVFSIADVFAKDINKMSSLNNSGVAENKQLNTQCSAEATLTNSTDEQNSESTETKNKILTAPNKAAVNLLLEILNDQCIRDLVVQRHEKTFGEYLTETFVNQG